VTYVVDADTVPPVLLQPLMSAGRTLIFHNGKFDLHFLRQAGLGEAEAEIFDTMIAEQLLKASDLQYGRGYFALDGLVERYLSLHLDKSEALRVGWDGELSHAKLQYAAADVHVLPPLAARLSEAITATKMDRVCALEMALIPALTWFESAGVPVDREAWVALSDAILAEIPDLVTEMDCYAAPYVQDLHGGAPIKWRSTSKDLPEFLRWYLETPLPNTTAATLAAFRGNPLIDALLAWRHLDKSASSFGSSWIEAIDADGCLYPEYAQCGSRAGRLSCRRPNLQQVPRSKDQRFRQCIVAPPEEVLVIGDFSQQEVVALAMLAQEPALLKALRVGEDVHRRVAATLNHVDMDVVTPAQRTAAKTTVFGIFYGMTARGLAHRLGWEEEAAQQLLSGFFRAYPQVRAYRQAMLRVAHRDGEVRTLTGRRRLLWQLDDPERGWRSRNMVFNTPVQGNCADVMKIAIRRLYDHQGEITGLRPLLSMHDELGVRVPQAQAPETERWLAHQMAAAMQEVFGPETPISVDLYRSQVWAKPEH
jgi:DNA polymerase-1